jgi:hypothetical protein
MSVSPRLLAFAFAIAASLALASREAGAQPLGTFRWRLSPYCNVVTLAVTQNGPLFLLDGTDNLCGPGPGAAVIGTAFFKPDGSVGMGLHLVVEPGAAPLHVNVSLNPANLSGTWTDSGGRTGPFLANPPSPAPGAPRPPGGAPITAIVLGEGLTELINGAGGGAMNLGVDFGGPGTAPTVARSDHSHAVANEGTAVGDSSLASNTTNAGFGNSAFGFESLRRNTTGGGNTAVGSGSLSSNTTGSENTAMGFNSLGINTSGSDNTALGVSSLFVNTTGFNNTAVGASSLQDNTSGANNTAIGVASLSKNTTAAGNTAVGQNSLGANSTGGFNTAIGQFSLANNQVGTENVAAGVNSLRFNGGGNNTAVGARSLQSNTTGTNNIAVGHSAGLGVTTGSFNIHIGHDGAAEERTIRLGTPAEQTRTFLAGVRDVGVTGGEPVLIDSNGQIGSAAPSTRHVKEGIEDLGALGHAVQRLRPVRFRYVEAFADGTRPLQYGLIAEEVAEVLPELTGRDARGLPATVKYHLLPVLLVGEVQRLERERSLQTLELAELRALVEAQSRELTRLRTLVDDMQPR